MLQSITDGKRLQSMSIPSPVQLELDDIQSGALHERPSPYVGVYLFVRIDSAPNGRELLRRLLPVVDSSRSLDSPEAGAWVTVALTYQGLCALGVPPESLASFSPEFRQGMAARAQLLGDVGENSPERWEQPLGTSDVHLAVAALSTSQAKLDAALTRAREAFRQIDGVELIWRQECFQLPNGRNPFGFADGMGQPSIEGNGRTPSNPLEAPLKAGEFILGYADETGGLPPMPYPEELGRNGTYLAFVKLHTRVAAFRQYLRSISSTPEEETRLAAKMVGRWQSGAPLTLAPDRDDPALGADPLRNNAYLYLADDAKGLRCPAGSHARRMNPRDSFEGEGSVDVRLHRMIRRGTSYGPPLPEGVLEDDGADRGIVFVFAGAHLGRQFEFVKSQWVNEGTFIGASSEQDPLIGPSDGTGMFTIPNRPIRRRLQRLPAFVVNRGGEYFFVPSLHAIQWLASLETSMDPASEKEAT
jgi:Dyp-type peroxidase family